MRKANPYSVVPASPAERRRWALGPQLWDWCDKVEPKLRGEVQAGMEDTANLSMITRQAIARLTIMPMETVEQAREMADELERLVNLRERNAATQEREVRMFNQLSAGGAASYWAAMQKGASKQQAETRDERIVKPARRFQLKAAEQGAAQPVDAEVIEAETE